MQSVSFQNSKWKFSIPAPAPKNRGTHVGLDLKKQVQE